MGTEALRTTVIAFAGLAAGLTVLSLRTAAIPINAPERLIAELRLAQISALVLAMAAGAYIGLAVAHEARPGVGLDIALAVGFFVVAASTLIRDPRHALTILALAFAAHAILDVGHRPGWPLPDAVAPLWYSIGCAMFDAYVGALCYWPILRR
jgi:predicted MPP superfamily phosphohydrolase